MRIHQKYVELILKFNSISNFSVVGLLYRKHLLEKNTKGDLDPLGKKKAKHETYWPFPFS